MYLPISKNFDLALIIENSSIFYLLILSPNYASDIYFLDKLFPKAKSYNNIVLFETFFSILQEFFIDPFYIYILLDDIYTHIFYFTLFISEN